MRKLGYIRTSTDKQIADRQIQQLQQVCDEVFIEDGVSAVGKERPVYKQATDALQKGDVFVVLSLDRAYRSVIDALVELDKMQKRGIEFLSLTQNFDTRTPEGRLLFTVSAALAEWERSILSQRTKDGMAAARRKGVHIGRPRKLTPEKVLWAKQQLQVTELPRYQIAEDLAVSPRTLQRAITC